MTLQAWPPIAAPAETGQTFNENARAKARYYADATGELTVAEDSGLEIDALDGAPGVESARFGGAAASYAQSLRLIYDALRAKGAIESPARFVCALALVRDAGGAVRNAGHDRRPHRIRTPGDRRLRLRPDLFLPALSAHARRSHRRRKGRGQPSRPGVSRTRAGSSIRR